MIRKESPEGRGAELRKNKQIRAAYVLKWLPSEAPTTRRTDLWEATMRDVNVGRVLLVEQPDGRDMLTAHRLDEPRRP